MNEPKKSGPKLLGATKRKAVNVAMDDETKYQLGYIQEKLGGVSRSEAIRRVVAKTFSILKRSS